MDIFSKFGICLICMLALVLLAVTPNSASSVDDVSSLGEPAPVHLSIPDKPGSPKA